ncbi:MAG: hypothetical protein WA872_11890 [Candidatus Sulfotelmatobacter sp.]
MVSRGRQPSARMRAQLIGAPPSAKLRDLLDHKDLGPINDSYAAEVPGHGVVMLRVSE